MGCRVESKIENLRNKTEALEERMNESFGKQEMKDEMQKFEEKNNRAYHKKLRKSMFK